MDAAVGREQELDTLGEFVTRSRERAGAFVLAGEAGIGKTTLWLAGLEAARGQGARVLMARPAAAERELAYTGLGDLLEEVIAEVLPALPAPRRRALEVALLLSDAEQRAPDAGRTARMCVTPTTISSHSPTTRWHKPTTTPIDSKSLAWAMTSADYGDRL